MSTDVKELPLAGKTIVVTRPRHLAESFGKKLEEKGGKVLYLPVIEIQPPDDFISLQKAARNLSSYDRVVFTSVNGVYYFQQALEKEKVALDSVQKPLVAAIGPSTARAAEENGFTVDIIPERYVAESLAEAMGEVSGQKILMPRAEIARPTLKELLQNKGAQVNEITAYKTQETQFSREDLLGVLDPPPDVVTFTSSSTVKAFNQLISQFGLTLKNTLFCCIGPVAEETAKQANFENCIVASKYDIDGMTDALEKYFSHAPH